MGLSLTEKSMLGDLSFHELSDKCHCKFKALCASRNPIWCEGYRGGGAIDFLKWNCAQCMLAYSVGTALAR